MAGMPKPIKLDKTVAEAFDRFVKAQEQVSKMRKYDAIAKEAKDELKKAFGSHQFGELPDGRVIQRLVDEQNRKRQAAKKVEVIKFKEFSIK